MFRIVWTGFFFLCLSAFSLIATATELFVYYHNDALGTPVAASDQNGSVVWRKQYLPFGEKSTDTQSSDLNSIGYTGHKDEPALGLVYMSARLYDPVIGRFYSVDPIEVTEDPATYNRYSYANNNPYRYVDPDGRAVETPWDVFNFGLGVASFGRNAAIGNYGGAAVDFVGLLWDGFSSAVPGVPGGAATAINGYRVKNIVVNGEKVANKTNLNSNNATSNFGLYEIVTPNGLEKVGKADLNRITQSSGLPTRLHQQVRKLEKSHGEGNVRGTVVDDLGVTTTSAAKAAENARISSIVDRTGRVPPGNEKSYRP